MVRFNKGLLRNTQVSSFLERTTHLASNPAECVVAHSLVRMAAPLVSVSSVSGAGKEGL